MIRNIDECENSEKDGEYGGASGLKEGIIIDGNCWLVKYPKNAKSLSRHEEMEYTNDPTSEYIGSHIYKILGFPTHETMLVERKGKIAVACKDFTTNNDRLVEIRTLKNTANNDMAERLDKEFNSTGSSHIINFEEIRLHLDYNHLLKDIDGIKERFYDQIVIDAFINNSDRNNGNWGILRSRGKKDILAPIYDNGGCLNGKTPDSRLKKMLDNPNHLDIIKQNVLNGISVFGDDKNFLVKDLLCFAIPELKNSLIKLVPIIKSNLKNISQMIDEIDERACSSIRKDFYKQILEKRIEYLLEPAYEKAINQEIQLPHNIFSYEGEEKLKNITNIINSQRMNNLQNSKEDIICEKE